MILEWERPNYNKNPKVIKEMNEKFDYKKKKSKVLHGKTQYQQSQQTRKNSCNSYKRKDQFPSIDELLQINKKKRLKLS